MGIVRTALTALALGAGPAMALGAEPATALAADLTVTVTGLRTDNGDVHIALYDRPEAFPDGDGMLDERKVPIQGGIASARFEGLAPGAYAVATYHDENGNHDFDTNVIGFPLEGYAFSKGAQVFLGPPTFPEAAFDVGDGANETRITMEY